LIILTLSAFFQFPAAAEPAGEYPHYVQKNNSRYEAYRAANPWLQYDMVIAYVNANVDKGGYIGVQTADKPDSISVLVNKNFALPTNFVPRDLVSIGNGFRLRKEAAEQFTDMRTEMLSMGFKLYVMAAYRTYQKQSSKHSGAVSSSGLVSADIQFARPGHSEHQTGLAVDIVSRTGISLMSQAKFEKTKEFAWLTENAHKYGFILRYPEDYTNIHGFIYEPWHWRYVGVDIATKMYNDGIVMFEEYYGWYLAPDIQVKIRQERLMRVLPD